MNSVLQFFHSENGCVFSPMHRMKSSCKMVFSTVAWNEFIMQNGVLGIPGGDFGNPVVLWPIALAESLWSGLISFEKIEGLKRWKKGLMQRVFPKANDTDA